jgi:hypothetical protein
VLHTSFFSRPDSFPAAPASAYLGDVARSQKPGPLVAHLLRQNRGGTLAA